MESWMKVSRQTIQGAPKRHLRAKVPIIIMARPLGILDVLIIAALIIIAAIVIYFLWPLIVVIIIIGAAYYIYKWYRHRM